MATELPAEQTGENSAAPREIDVPASTAWPLVLAFGFTLLFAGLLTSVSVTVLGAVLSVAACAGWFREVFPQQHEEAVTVVSEDFRVTTRRRIVERLPVTADQLRAWLPVHTYPVSAGVKGGLAGGGVHSWESAVHWGQDDETGAWLRLCGGVAPYIR